MTSDGTPDLTKRELSVVKCLTEGKANKIIAHELCLSEGTVKQNLAHIYRKLHIYSRLELALWAVGKYQPEGNGQ